MKFRFWKKRWIKQIQNIQLCSETMHTSTVHAFHEFKVYRKGVWCLPNQSALLGFHEWELTNTHEKLNKMHFLQQNTALFNFKSKMWLQIQYKMAYWKLSLSTNTNVQHQLWRGWYLFNFTEAFNSTDCWKRWLYWIYSLNLIYIGWIDWCSQPSNSHLFCAQLFQFARLYF